MRFAPSPNGYLHAGHAYSAWRNFAFAKRHGGRFLLRIEDIDAVRARPEYEAAIFEDLSWLGIAWEMPVRRQSEHLEEYRTALSRLQATGLAYPCFCTRGMIRAACVADSPRDPDGSPHYPGTCRAISAAERSRRIDRGEAYALRIDMAKALERIARPLTWREYGEGASETVIDANPLAWGDAVLARKDIGTSYHVAVVRDDAQQHVTDVIRGTDLFEATALHRLLQELLGLPQPKYRHHRLVLDENGDKLSKSAGTKPLRSLRAEGLTAERLFDMLGVARG